MVSTPPYMVGGDKTECLISSKEKIMLELNKTHNINKIK